MINTTGQFSQLKKNSTRHKCNNLQNSDKQTVQMKNKLWRNPLGRMLFSPNSKPKWWHAFWLAQLFWELKIPTSKTWLLFLTCNGHNKQIWKHLQIKVYTELLKEQENHWTPNTSLFDRMDGLYSDSQYKKTLITRSFLYNN